VRGERNTRSIWLGNVKGETTIRRPGRVKKKTGHGRDVANWQKV